MSDEEFAADIQPREHRAGAWVLLVVGVAALGLGVYQWRSSILRAFEKEPSKYRSLEQQEQDRLTELKTKDTDSDGINDYDESYVFLTSPYLEDSDSDGISDLEELKAGSDPNCPKGKDCGPLGGGVVADPFEDNLSIFPENDGELEIVDQMLNPTIEQIRQLLLDSGIDKNELANIDDDVLMELYSESLLEVQGSLLPN